MHKIRQAFHAKGIVRQIVLKKVGVSEKLAKTKSFCLARLFRC